MRRPTVPPATQATPVWFAEHLSGKPHTRVRGPEDVAARDRELSEVANSYLSRRKLFAHYGTAEDNLDVVRSELLARGCAEPDALLEGVARNLRDRRRAA